MDKLGQPVAPDEVIRGGNRHLHAIGSGVSCRGRRIGLAIDTLDAPLVAPGHRALLEWNNRRLGAVHAMHFLLYNNLWGTNFRMWYGAMRASVSYSDSSPERRPIRRAC
jgi:hypothetical protein